MKKILRLTESDIHNMIKEAVEDVLDNDRRYYEWIQGQQKKHQALADFLNRNGVKSAHLSAYQSGYPVVALDTDEYHETDAWAIADKFVKGKRAYISVNSFPATTYFVINDGF